MNRLLIAAAAIALAAASGLASAAPWTVVVQPGVYGRVAIGGLCGAAGGLFASARRRRGQRQRSGRGRSRRPGLRHRPAAGLPVGAGVPAAALGAIFARLRRPWRAGVLRRRRLVSRQRAASQLDTRAARLDTAAMARPGSPRTRSLSNANDSSNSATRQQQRWNSQRGWYSQQQRQATAADGGRAAGLAGNPGPQQTAAASQANGDRRGEEHAQARGERGERRGRAEGLGAFERGHGGNRER